MYRQYLHEKQAEGEWFLSRMCELPMVNSAVEQLTALYSGVKQHNRVFRFTLDTAEGGMHMVYQTAGPVLSKFDKPSKIDICVHSHLWIINTLKLLCIKSSWLSHRWILNDIVYCYLLNHLNFLHLLQVLQLFILKITV